MAKVKDLDFVVATRMHMMIMSLCVGTPVLPIAYEFKTKELSKRIGIDNLLLEIDTVTPEQAAASLETFISDFDHYTRAQPESRAGRARFRHVGGGAAQAGHQDLGLDVMMFLKCIPQHRRVLRDIFTLQIRIAVRCFVRPLPAPCPLACRATRSAPFGWRAESSISTSQGRN